MFKRVILPVTIALLLQPLASIAEDFIPAQPITVETTVGNEQSDFFLSRDRKDNEKLTFSANLKTLTSRGVSRDERVLFSQRIEGFDRSDSLVTFFAVNKFAPLSKLTTYLIPAGSMLDSFLFNSNSENAQTDQGLPQEFFHVPSHGLYFSTGGAKPALVKAVTGAFNGWAMQQPDFTANDKDHSEAFRVVLEANDKKHGNEPYVSEGPSRTTVLLDDIIAGTAGSNPRSFTTSTEPTSSHEVAYFLADDTGGTSGVYKTIVNTTNPHVAKYGATEITSGLASPSALVGNNSGLLLLVTLDQSNVPQLYASDGDGVFTQANGGGTNPEDVTPNPEQDLDGTGYTSLDGSAKRRFTQYSSITGDAFFTDTMAAITDPTNIIGTGDYFYYDAVDGGQGFFWKDFTGGGGPEIITDTSSFTLTNAREICYVHGSSFEGSLYFVADEIGGSSDILYKLDANGSSTVAAPVLTVASHPVVGAHNLRCISNDDLFRLYFCAPVSPTQNAEYLPKDKHGVTINQDFGTKPWVTNDE